MKGVSFRLKIALTTATLCGIILVAFGISAWALVYRERLQNLDKDLILSFDRHRAQLRGPRSRQLLQERLDTPFHTSSGTPISVRIVFRRNAETAESESWPAGFTPDFRTKIPPEMNPTQPNAPDPLELLDDTEPDRNTRDPSRPNFPERFRERSEQRGGRPFQRQDGEGFPDNEGGPSGGPPWRGIGPERRRLNPPLPIVETFTFQDQAWRVAMIRDPESDWYLAANMQQFNADLIQIRNAFIMAFPFALGLVAAGGWQVSRNALKPLELIGNTAQQVTAKGLDQRIPNLSRDSEIKNLVQIINGMLNRLENSFHQANRFSADASHELKTPLAIMQGEIESALKSATHDIQKETLLLNLLDEVQRLKNITQSLLLLSQADSGELRMTKQILNPRDLVEAVAEDSAILAETSRIQVKTEITEDVTCQMDPALIQLVLSNLAGNAVKYNRTDGTLLMKLFKRGSYAVFHVENTGPGISEKNRDRIFDRFFRGDQSHTRDVDGFGLGLSLSREIARAHGGDLELIESQPEKTVFELRLPLKTRHES